MSKAHTQKFDLEVSLAAARDHMVRAQAAQAAAARDDDRERDCLDSKCSACGAWASPWQWIGSMGCPYCGR